MKKSFFIIPVVSVLLGAGCFNAPSSPVAVAPAAEEAPSAETSVVTVSGLSFTLPKEWTLLDIEHKTNAISEWDIANIKVPDPRFNVVIPFKVNKRDIKIDGSWTLLAETSTGAKIYSDFCAPSIACYVIAYKGNTYSAGFGEPKSDEQPPANLDAPWFPSTTVTAKQTLDIVATVR